MQVETRRGNPDDKIVSEVEKYQQNLEEKAYFHLLSPNFFNSFKSCFFRLESELHVSVEHYRGRTLSAKTH